jgi:hypothetical protein
MEGPRAATSTPMTFLKLDNADVATFKAAQVSVMRSTPLQPRFYGGILSTSKH